MMENILNIDGPLLAFLNKTGQLIALSVLWLLCCIPVITIPAATTALYYAVCKSIRFDTGSAVKEFIRSFRANCLRCMAAGIPVALLMALLMLNLLFIVSCIPIVTIGASSAALYNCMQKLLEDRERCSTMRKALMESSMPDSADRICDIIAELAKK